MLQVKLHKTPKNPTTHETQLHMKDQERYRYDMLILAKMGYNIISNISRILKILYHIIYPNMRYYIRYRHAMIYIYPTTGRVIYALPV